jgi:hypothetical protein
VGTDSRAQLSPVVSVAGSAAAFGLFPNPTRSLVTLTGPADAPLTLTLTSLYGQLLQPLTTGLLPTANEALNAALPQLPAGVYMVTVESQGQRTHLKLVKE